VTIANIRCAAVIVGVAQNSGSARRKNPEQDVRLWHFADINFDAEDVRFRG
jgi:hypothetical protein